jgi:hypothetical protein
MLTWRLHEGVPGSNQSGGTGAGVAVRSLERRTRSLESLFLELTAKAETAAVAS